MDLQLIKRFIKEKWIYLIIMFGLFLVLWQPKIQISQNAKDSNINTKKWFSEIPLDGDYSDTNTIKNTKTKDIKEASVEQYKITTKQLEKNKKLIMMECIRREPDLSTWSTWNLERKNIPTLDYVIEILESKYDKEDLYGDIEKGVNIILKKAGVIK
jgi:hypothetical protein